MVLCVCDEWVGVDGSRGESDSQACGLRLTFRVRVG